MIDPTLWDFFLRGAGIFDKTDMPKKPDELYFISDANWELIYQLDQSSQSDRRLNTEESPSKGFNSGKQTNETQQDGDEEEEKGEE